MPNLYDIPIADGAGSPDGKRPYSEVGDLADTDDSCFDLVSFPDDDTGTPGDIPQTDLQSSPQDSVPYGSVEQHLQQNEACLRESQDFGEEHVLAPNVQLEPKEHPREGGNHPIEQPFTEETPGPHIDGTTSSHKESTLERRTGVTHDTDESQQKRQKQRSEEIEWEYIEKFLEMKFNRNPCPSEDERITLFNSLQIELKCVQVGIEHVHNWFTKRLKEWEGEVGLIQTTDNNRMNDDGSTLSSNLPTSAILETPERPAQDIQSIASEPTSISTLVDSRGNAYPCQNCKDTCFSEWKRHEWEVHFPSEVYYCLFCRISPTVENDCSITWECKLCHTKHPSLDSAEDHILGRTSNRCCNTRKGIWTNVRRWETHLETVHPSHDPNFLAQPVVIRDHWKCVICEKSYDSKADAENHECPKTNWVFRKSAAWPKTCLVHPSITKFESPEDRNKHYQDIHFKKLQVPTKHSNRRRRNDDDDEDGDIERDNNTQYDSVSSKNSRPASTRRRRRQPSNGQKRRNTRQKLNVNQNRTGNDSPKLQPDLTGIKPGDTEVQDNERDMLSGLTVNRLTMPVEFGDIPSITVEEDFKSQSASLMPLERFAQDRPPYEICRADISRLSESQIPSRATSLDPHIRD